MMDCTDRHCRYFMRLLSRQTLLYTEMVVGQALVHGNRARFLNHRGDDPVALQLGGSDPAMLIDCAKWGEEAGYAEINLNCGCPSDRVQVGGIGTCLMAQPELVADCWQAMQHAVDIPVTIKSRIGIDDADSYEHFEHFISTLYNAGCRIFIVHARKAILFGLSPKENREIPPLKYDYVYRIRETFPDATFVINGGIGTVAEAAAEADKTDGVMIGRAVYSNLLLLADLDAKLLDGPGLDLDAFLNGTREYLARELAEGTQLKHMARHLLGLFSGWHGARHFRRELSEGMTSRTAGLTLFDSALTRIGERRSA